MKIEKIPEGYLLARKGGNGCELWRKFNGAESLACDAIDELIAERDALRAKIEAMEKQEPVGEIQRANSTGNYICSEVWVPLSVGAKLYAFPGAQGLASSQDEWRTLAKDLLREVERQTCAHEETHRGGFLWEICDACGAKWADDEGGKPEFKWPKVVEKARAMLEADPGAKGE